MPGGRLIPSPIGYRLPRSSGMAEAIPCIARRVPCCLAPRASPQGEQRRTSAFPGRCQVEHGSFFDLTLADLAPSVKGEKCLSDVSDVSS